MKAKPGLADELKVPLARGKRRSAPRAGARTSNDEVKTEDSPKLTKNGKRMGRPPGSKDVHTIRRELALKMRQLKEQPKNVDLMPLDYILSIMRDSKKKWPVRFQAAIAAAPYLHHRLAQISAAIPEKMVIEVEGGIPKDWKDDDRTIEGTAVEIDPSAVNDYQKKEDIK